MGPVPRLDVEGLHERLCERIAELHPLVVADVIRVFLEVSSLPCEQMVWSFEFAFDEDDSRIARVEARFANRGAPNPSDEELRGYEAHVLLPAVFPAGVSGDAARATKLAPVSAGAQGTLVARFIAALAELGAYRAIETLEARSVDVYLL